MATGHVKLYADSGSEEWTLPPPAITHLAIVPDLLAAIAEARPNCVSGREGRKTNAVLQAAMQSSQQRRTVKLT